MRYTFLLAKQALAASGEAKRYVVESFRFDLDGIAGHTSEFGTRGQPHRRSDGLHHFGHLETVQLIGPGGPEQERRAGEDGAGY